MKLIIDIPEDILEKLRKQYVSFSGSLEGKILKAVANGVPLDKARVETTKIYIDPKERASLEKMLKDNALTEEQLEDCKKIVDKWIKE